MDISRRNWIFQSIAMTIGGGLFAVEGQTDEEARATQEETVFKVYPVGKVKKAAGTTFLEIFDKYVDAIKGLENYSHLFVIYWFHQNDTPEKRSILEVHPMGKKEIPLTGVFACRSPVRPNLIALSLCKILSLENNRIIIDKIDAFNDSPIIDLKPYVPALDSTTEKVRLPDW